MLSEEPEIGASNNHHPSNRTVIAGRKRPFDPSQGGPGGYNPNYNVHMGGPPGKKPFDYNRLGKRDVFPIYCLTPFVHWVLGGKFR